MKLENTSGLSVDFLESGLVRSITAAGIRIGMKEATPFSKHGPAIWLRKRGPVPEFIPLLGPLAPGNRIFPEEGRFVSAGEWQELTFRVTLELSATEFAWQWSVEIVNNSPAPVEADLFFVQDAGLKPASEGSINEYYVSQYLERLILQSGRHGAVVCCRQNMRGPTGHPWLMLALGNGAAAASTDGMQWYGKRFRATGIPEGLYADNLTGEYAGESSVVALQEPAFTLAPGGRHLSTCRGLFLPDHQEATSPSDLALLEGLETLFPSDAGTETVSEGKRPVFSIFDALALLDSEELTERELETLFSTERRHPEYEAGNMLSFFHGDAGYVMLREKELLADRPHGHILQACAGTAPDERVISVTCFASGVFASHITQGNTNFTNLLSVCSDPFGLAPETGLRIFANTGKGFQRLGVPSAFETGLNHCRWIYKSEGRMLQIRTWTAPDAPHIHLDAKFLTGEPVYLTVTHDFDPLNGWKVIQGNSDAEYIAVPEAGSMIAGKFPDAQYRIAFHGDPKQYRENDPIYLFSGPVEQVRMPFVISRGPAESFAMTVAGEVPAAAPAFVMDSPDLQWARDNRLALENWKNLSLGLSVETGNSDLQAIREILPWFGQNALVHFLTPYGLEQFSGAAWGTRDVSQGPFDLLLAAERYGDARKVLCIMFSNQGPEGGWPQWWMFDRFHEIRAGDAHGDVVYWCILALCDYIVRSGDFAILDEVLPYYHPEGPENAEQEPLRSHLDRLTTMITASFIPGTALVPFGHGDWNDSLQPVSVDLARRLISSWTVEMNYQAFDRLGRVWEKAGDTAKATMLRELCTRIRADFNTHLVRDGIVAGYGLVEENGRIGVLLHPSDRLTGIRYSILPMNRGIISGIFTAEQARRHQALIEEHLKGPDGARLMDRPLKYHGGIQTIFQRAESSTFFGREIGLMYVHEHLRYAEALARTGQAEAFLAALRQAVPVAYRDAVPCGDIRQSNCYYSSSDVAFRSRYDADERYDEIKTGKLTLRGGWRVYSSGPGIFVGMVLTRLLGLRVDAEQVVLDPVLPHSLDGLTALLRVLGFPVTFFYRVKGEGFGPSSIVVNGRPIAFSREENPYRTGGAVISKSGFLALLNTGKNTMEVVL